MEAAVWKIRDIREGDLPFVFQTWLKSFKTDSHFAHRIRDTVYFPNHHLIVEILLERATTLVACLEDDEDVILGYLTFERDLRGMPVLHYAFVKEAWRRNGVARSLYAASGLPADLESVHLSHANRFWFSTRDRPGLEDQFPGAIYNPYAL